MPPTRIRLVLAFCLMVPLVACAPAAKKASPTPTARTVKKSTPPAQSQAPQSPPAAAPAGQGFRVVMGEPLPETPRTPAAGQGQTPLAAQVPAPFMLETAPVPMATPGQTVPTGQAAATGGVPVQEPAVPAPQPAVADQTAGAVPMPAFGQAPAPGQTAPASQTTAPGLAADANPAAPGAQPTGYGGLKWGDSAQSFPGLAAYETDKATGVVTYLWPQGPRDVFGAPIRETYYEFYKNRFYHVWIEYDGMAAYKTALAGLIRAYGPPTQENPAKYYHAWNLGEVNVYCAYHPRENDGDVSYFYQPIYEPMMAARKAQAKAAPRSKKP